MNGTDVTGPCAALKYGIIVLTCGSQKEEFRHDGKPIGRNIELWAVWFGYWKTETEPSDGLPQTTSQNQCHMGSLALDLMCMALALPLTLLDLFTSLLTALYLLSHIIFCFTSFLYFSVFS